MSDQKKQTPSPEYTYQEIDLLRHQTVIKTQPYHDELKKIMREKPTLESRTELTQEEIRLWDIIHDIEKEFYIPLFKFMEQQDRKPAKVFNFWKDNLKTGHFTLCEPELKVEFSAWLKTKELPWLKYYDLRNILTSFVTSHLKSSLNSDNNYAELKEMEIFLNPVLQNYMLNQKSDQ